MTTASTLRPRRRRKQPACSSGVHGGAGYRIAAPHVCAWYPVEIEIFAHRVCGYCAAVRLYAAAGMTLAERAECVERCRHFSAAIEIGTHGLFAELPGRWAGARR